VLAKAVAFKFIKVLSTIDLNSAFIVKFNFKMAAAIAIIFIVVVMANYY